MKLNEHIVSIILPVHNASQYLQTCLDSLVKQTHQDIEIIAIDDKSTDNSYAILKDFAKKDKRIRVFGNKKHYGLSICFNRCLKRARGQFVAFMSPSDTSARHRVQTQLAYLRQHPKIAVVGAQCRLLDQKNQEIGTTDLPKEHETIYQKLFDGASLQFESVMVNRLLLPKDVLKFKKHTYPFLYIDVFLQVLRYGKAANLSELLHCHRKLQTSKTLKNLSKRHVQSFFTVFGKSLASPTRPSLRSVFTPLVKGV